MIPTLLIVFTAQYFLIRSMTQKTINETDSKIDVTLPHPSERYDAKEVVQVILYSMRNMDIPKKDSGQIAAWQFMTSRLQTQLRDKALIRPYLSEDIWKALLDFDSYTITHSKIEDKSAIIEVSLISSKRLTRQLIFALTKPNEMWLIDQIVKRI
ncbi:MAG: hypothetical protein K2P81_16470 [Bacteriovoracaceae bacterium]|nr:hypothetical protein [Bacteriovoracaceae bacterium]